MVDLNEFSPIERSAQVLVDRARKLVKDPSQSLDILHIMLAVVQDPWPMREFRDSPAISRWLNDSGAMLELLGALHLLLRLTSGPTAQSAIPSSHTFSSGNLHDSFSTALRQCLERARGHWPAIPLTDAMIVWAILVDNNQVRTAVLALEEDHPGIRCQAITDELELLVHRSGTSPISPSSQGSDHRAFMPVHLPAHETAKHVLRHGDLMVDITDELQHCSPGQFVLVSGRNGTPLHYVGQILADALADRVAAGGTRPLHLRYSGVWTANIASYLRWSNPPIVQSADVLLQEGIQHVQAQGGVLVLEHVEKLAPLGTLERHLLGQLTIPTGAAIVALYQEDGIHETGALRAWDPEQEKARVLRALDLDSETARLVPIPPYNWRHALATIREYFIPEWEAQGFVLDGVLLDEVAGPYHDLLALAEGAQVGGEHMALPYLLVEVTEQVFKYVHDVEGILTCAKNVHDRIRDLLGERAREASSDVVQHFRPLLLAALQEVQRLQGTQDVFVEREEHFVITRAHLTAQFLGSRRSSFHYPATIPTEVMTGNGGSDLGGSLGSLELMGDTAEMLARKQPTIRGTDEHQGADRRKQGPNQGSSTRR